VGVRPLFFTCAVLASACCWAQEPTDPFNITGSIQQAFTSGRLGGNLKTDERFRRTQIQVEKGNYKLIATEWDYPFCGWRELDQAGLFFESGPTQAQAGRFLLPFNLVTWDAQWYSAFNFVPLIEFNFFDGRRMFERTVSGTRASHTSGNLSYDFAAFGSRNDVDKLAPVRYDRAFFKVNHYNAGLNVGLSHVQDAFSATSRQSIHGVYANYTIPHWTIRGSALTASESSFRTDGYFVDLSHRAKNWTDLTLAARMEKFNRGLTSQQQWVLAAKIELKSDTVFNINYSGGPDMNRVTLGGGFSLHLQKTFKF
jgi:hypothetical protein